MALSEAKQWEVWARQVADEVLIYRGYRPPSTAPREVVASVFSLLNKYTRTYERYLESGMPPKEVARLIQNMAWDGLPDR